MSESAGSSTPPNRPPRRWAAFLIAAGTAFVILSGGGLLLLPLIPEAPVVVPAFPVSATPVRRDPPTPPDQPRIDRQIVGPPTFTPSPSPVVTVVPPTAGSTSAAATPESASTAESAPTQQAQSSSPEPVGTPIAWSEAEKNALSWMCYYEVGGMGFARFDGCLSVISTVRARYVYGSGMGSDVLSVLGWPNQFNIPIKTDAPHTDMYPTVEQYQNGARGSCSGYFYFDSAPGGPSLCVIYGAANSFIEFHNGWN